MPKKRLPGRPPALAINAKTLKKVERLGRSGVTKKIAAGALMISYDTFNLYELDNASFASAWAKGRAAYFDLIAVAAPRVIAGLIVNATTPTKFEKGGNVRAQLGFSGKMLEGMNDREAEAKEKGQDEIHEVVFRIINPGKGGQAPAAGATTFKPVIED